MPRVILKSDKFTQVYLDGSNQFRYRIITDDRNKWSHWSPVLNLKRPGIYDVQDSGLAQTGVFNYEIDNSKFTIFWQPFASANSYDIFFSKNEHTALSYYNTTTNNFIIIPLQPTDIVSFTQTNGVTVDHTANTFTVAIPELQTGDGLVYTSSNPITPLISNQHYHVRILSGNTFALYNTVADALADTNRVNLQSTVTGDAKFTKVETATVLVQLSSYPQEINAELRYVQVSADYPVTSYF